MSEPGSVTLKAIVLCAGQGKRLLPLTERAPKCLLRVGGRSILEWQLRGLSAAGIAEVTLVTGFEAAAIEAALPGITPPGLRVRTRFNPFFAVAENIGSCFLVRDLLLEGDTVLLNGDTLFEPAVLRHLLAADGHAAEVRLPHLAARREEAQAPAAERLERADLAEAGIDRLERLGRGVRAPAQIPAAREVDPVERAVGRAPARPFRNDAGRRSPAHKCCP